MSFWCYIYLFLSRILHIHAVFTFWTVYINIKSILIFFIKNVFFVFKQFSLKSGGWRTILDSATSNFYGSPLIFPGRRKLFSDQYYPQTDCRYYITSTPVFALRSSWVQVPALEVLRVWILVSFLTASRQIYGLNLKLGNGLLVEHAFQVTLQQ